MVKTGLPRVNFSEEWNKLINRQIGDEFHTVRWMDQHEWYLSLIDKEIEVWVQGVPRYKVIVTKVVTEKLCNLTEKFVQEDTYPGMTVGKFFDMMADWYASKPDWKGWDSTVVIVYLMVSEVL